MRPILWLIAVALLAGAGWVWWRGELTTAPGSQPDPAEQGVAPVDATAVTVEDVPAPTKGLLGKRDVPTTPTTRDAAAPAEGVVAPTVRPAVRTTLDVTAVSQQLTTDTREWNSQDYFDLAEAVDQPTAEEAYRAYKYLTSCLDAPRGPAAMEAQIAEYEERHLANPEAFTAELLERLLNNVELGYQRCDGLALDIIDATYRALEASADQGFLPAIVEYLVRGAPLLLKDSGWLFAHPDYADRYRLRAQTYARHALAAGQPETIAAYGQFLFRGTVAPPDRVAGYAHVWVAAQLPHRAHDEAQRNLQLLENEMTLDEIEAGRAMGERLCERWCEE